MTDPELKAAVRLAKFAIVLEKAHAVYFPAPAHEMAELASEVMIGEGILYWISSTGDAITCTKCRMTSYNPNDVAQRYCGHCRVFFGDQPFL